ncbi:hypothetical protein [Streptomyces sp. NPDC087300]|uniref:hypothetical protein n=1 Tax=Streptomyces sp. NPDC087300 TaxID=3365780 RepID=UPI003801DF0D
MRTSFLSTAGSVLKPNEDYLAVNPHVALVVDGLSSPPELGSGCVHGTPWYVARLSTYLLHAATSRPHHPLADCAAEAISRVAGLHRDTCDLAHPGTPSSSIALLREGPDTVDHLSLFDSVLLVDGPAGLNVISDHRADDFAQEEHKATLAHRIGTEEHRLAVSALVAAQRPHRNVAGGYWVAGSAPEAADHALTGSLPRAEVTRAAVMSDGASCLVEDYGVTGWGEMLDLLGEKGTGELVSRVRAAEAGDPEGTRWPRYKAGDDCSVIYCEFDDAV